MRDLRRVPLETTRALRRSVLRPHQTLEELASEEASDSFAIGAFERGELIAVGLVSPDGPPGHWRVRGMATAPEARGRGAGAAVLTELLGHASSMGAVVVWCNARTPARSLYERAGLRVVSEEFDLPEIGPHLRMERDDRENAAESGGEPVTRDDAGD